MKLDPQRYDQMVRRASPHSPVGKDCLWAFFVGGGICLGGELLRQTYLTWYDAEMAGTLTSITLIFASAVATLFGWYQKLATRAGAGTLVPITGFANAMVSPALEFKSEGLILGTGARMFAIAGPVLVYGISASVLYGLLWFLFGQA